MATLKYVHLLSFAKVEPKNGSTEVTLLDKEGNTIGKKPLIFNGTLPPNRVFITVLNGNDVNLINVLAEFDENQFKTLKQDISILGEWETLLPSDDAADMNPIGEPPRNPEEPAD